jgi:protein-tyrosine-phosphatase
MPRRISMTTHVLFLCPHSAGKSVFAATYFRAAAARLGVDAVADVAGTEPDDDVMPDVRAAIEAQGFSITDLPKTVSRADVERAFPRA